MLAPILLLYSAVASGGESGAEHAVLAQRPAGCASGTSPDPLVLERALESTALAPGGSLSAASLYQGLTLDALACTNTVVSRELALRLHQGRALTLDAEGADMRLTAASVRAAVHLSTSGDPFAASMAEDSRLRELAETARARGPGGSTPVHLPVGLGLVVDGEPASARPTDRAVVAQLVRADQSVVWSGYLAPADPLPAALDSEPGGKRLTLAAGLATVAVGGGLYLAAWSGRRSYLDVAEPRTPAELAELRARTNRLATAGLVAGGIGLGLCVSALPRHGASIGWRVVW